MRNEKAKKGSYKLRDERTYREVGSKGRREKQRNQIMGTKYRQKEKSMDVTCDIKVMEGVVNEKNIE